MKAFTTLNSQVIPLDMDNVDTDMIIPAQFLTKIAREGYGKHIFMRLREQDPNFVWNDPKHHSSNILLTKDNFGCGSSREHAVWALLQAGIKVVIADSYSDIFYNNAEKNGLLSITLPSGDIANLMRQVQEENIEMHINLENQIISTSKNETFHFDYDPFRKTCLLKGLDDLDYLLEVSNV